MCFKTASQFRRDALRPFRPAANRLGRRILAACVLPILACMTGCFPGGLGALDVFIPTEEELDALREAQREFDEFADSLPLISVRMVNATDTIARIEINASVDFGDFVEGTNLDSIAETFLGAPILAESVDSATVFVLPGGTATGEIRCGQSINISASAPYNLDLGFFGGGETFTFQSGNVSFSGAGSSSDGGFTGDTVAVTRVLRPDSDALDCVTNTIEIRIDTAATGGGIETDPDTGEETVTASTPGAGTITIE